MRRQGFVDGIACAAAFFHRELCPLCGGGFRRCRSESLLFTPAEEGGRCPPACRLRHGLGKSYRKAFTESHISTQKSGRDSCRFLLYMSYGSKEGAAERGSPQSKYSWKRGVRLMVPGSQIKFLTLLLDLNQPVYCLFGGAKQLQI